jgi:hypothetical protein
MVWPIPPLATTRKNDDPQFDTHPADHNALADAINELRVRMPRGYIARATQSTPGQAITNVDVDVNGCTVTWNADPARRYKLTARLGGAKTSAAGEAYAFITDAANGRIAGAAFTAGINGSWTIYLEAILTGLSGSTTRKLRCSANPPGAVLGSNEYLGNLTLEDVGPNP